MFWKIWALVFAATAVVLAILLARSEPAAAPSWVAAIGEWFGAAATFAAVWFALHSNELAEQRVQAERAKQRRDLRPTFLAVRQEIVWLRNCFVKVEAEADTHSNPLRARAWGMVGMLKAHPLLHVRRASAAGTNFLGAAEQIALTFFQIEYLLELAPKAETMLDLGPDDETALPVIQSFVAMLPDSIELFGQAVDRLDLLCAE